MARKRLRKQEYTVGCICALPRPEWKASRMLLDEVHEEPFLGHSTSHQYVFGSMEGHNVVMGCLPTTQIGTASTASVATEMNTTFPCLRFGLLVGIGGGVPGKQDIRLGDVVVSQPDPPARHGGVVQYDFGKATDGGKFQLTGSLNQPPDILLSALAKVQATPQREYHFDRYLTHKDLQCEPEFAIPPETDRLFLAPYPHAHEGSQCTNCNAENEVQRTPRNRSGPVVHYGTIASGNQVMKDAEKRGVLSRQYHDILCFEMEAAGVINRIPCLVIRGICDYCDSHKNKEWQPYAAMAAAAWAKYLLSNITPGQVEADRSIGKELYKSQRTAISPMHPKALRPQEILCWQRRGGCGCGCHKTTLISSAQYRYFFARTHGVLLPERPCEQSCNHRRYGMSVRFAFTVRNRSFAFNVTLDLDLHNARPYLSVQRNSYACPYTAPGFVKLWELEHCVGTLLGGSSSTYSQLAFDRAVAQQVAEIKRMFAAREAHPLDVDPQGETWLEKLLFRPWGIGLRAAQWDLNEFLAPMSDQIKTNGSLLWKCATWIGEGPHMPMFYTLIRLGLDPGNMDRKLLREWPSICDPNWQSEGIIPDPCFLEWLRGCLRIEPGFAECNALSEAVLTADDAEFQRALDLAQIKSYEKPIMNIWGQSAMHLAILSPKRLEKLLENGGDSNRPDRGGSTPLMYAAAYGCSESVQLLLDHGASPLIDDGEQYRRTFLEYAVKRNHWHIINNLVRRLRMESDDSSAEAVLRRCVVYYLVNGSDHWNGYYLRRLLRLGADANTTCPDGSTLMHLARHSEEAQAIMDAGFTSVSAANSDGTTPIMASLSQRLSFPTVAGLLELGADIEAQDDRGWTALHHACKHAANAFIARSYQGWQDEEVQYQWDLIANVNILLSRGKDPLARDLCRDHEHDLTVLFDDIRRYRAFEQARMTHTCCRGRTRMDHLYHVQWSDRDAVAREHENFEATIMPGSLENPTTVKDDVYLELAKLYKHLENLSRAAQEPAIARKNQNDEKRRMPTHEVDYERDEFCITTYFSELPSASRFDRKKSESLLDEFDKSDWKDIESY